MGDFDRGLRYVLPEYCETTYPKVPETPFPGVAPVPTIRIHRDCETHEGIDMMDENKEYQGKAKPWATMNIGAGGKLGVDPGRPRTGGPLPKVSFGVDLSMPPIRRARKGK